MEFLVFPFIVIIILFDPNFFIIFYSLASGGRNRSTILATESSRAFANAMNSMNLSLSYDWAIAFMK
jgi:hypothetical protein